MRNNNSFSKSLSFSNSSATTVKIAFVEPNGNRVEIDATVGKSVLDAALEHHIDVEGACGGVMACSTCHAVLPDDLFKKLPPKSDEEQDMLDLAWGLTDT